MQENVQEARRIVVDEGGFLADLKDWSEEVARELAAREGIASLSDSQLDILRFLRNYYRKYEFFPIIGTVCTHVSQPRTCITASFRDPVTAWKIAGLPNPGEEVNRFRSWEPLGY
jgi:tRNA 2-thiouridine synthesizing protein E